MMKANRRDLATLRRTLAGVAVGLLVFSCAPSFSAPPVSPQLVKTSPAPQSRLERGYQVHQAKCAKCHAFEDPADYGVEELTKEIMPVMARKSKLDAADADAVLAYLLAARKMPPPP